LLSPVTPAAADLAYDSPEHKTLTAGASDRDKSMSADLATLDRRIYTQLSEDGAPVGRPAPVVLAVALSVPAESEDDLAAWYTQENILMLLEVPGWRRIRRLWVPTISSTSRDQATFVDHATGASLPSYAVLAENNRLW
jgi:hypothetical protein